MVTAKDVAKRAGVSPATVSYVMSGNRPISEETKRRVRQAMKDLAYYPNANARALARHRTGVIGMVVKLDEHTQMAELLPYLSTLLDELDARDYALTLIPGHADARGIRKSAGQAQVDGILVFDIAWHDQRIDELVDIGAPTVLIGTTEDPKSLSSIDVDYGRIAQLAVNELTNAGAQRIIAVGDADQTTDRYEFSHRFLSEGRSTAQVLDLEFEEFIPPCGGWQGIWAMRDLLLERRAEHCGIAVRTPQTLEWVMQLMFELGISPSPDDMPLVAVCSDSYAVSTHVPVSNIDPMAGDISRAAVEELLALIENPKRPPTRTLVTPHVTTRSTT